MRMSIGSRVILAVAVVTAATIGGMSALMIRAHRAELIAELERSTTQLGEAIRHSAHYDMLENRRESLHQQILGLGREQGIEKVRVFDQDGTIAFSTDVGEIGTSVDKRAEACYGCHASGKPLSRLPMKQRSRIYRAADGHRVLGTIVPIPNEPGCSAGACHAHSPQQSVLGVLDVNVTLTTVDKEIADSQRRFALWAALAILATSVVLWWLTGRLVIEPTRALAVGTKRVADGDLTTTVPVTRDDELGALATTFNDMTRRLREAQTQLVAADKLASVGRLAAGVAHEINNPLTGVLTYATFLLKRIGDDSASREDLEVIVRETKRCREIVRNLLDYARQSPPHRQQVSLEDIVRHAAGIVQNQLAKHQAALHLELAGDLPPVTVDGNQIEQVLVNLLLNAADALGDAGGQITVRTRRDGPRGVALEVEDTGCGIPAADVPRIFEPFFSTKGTRGTGLGLAVTWSIVARHQGTIEVDSTPGRGSRFTVRLPGESATAAPNVGDGVGRDE